MDNQQNIYRIGSNSDEMESNIVYSINKKCIQKINNLNVSRHFHSVLHSSHHGLIVLGGINDINNKPVSTIECLSKISSQWEINKFSKMPTAKYKHSCTLFNNDKHIIECGGFDSNNNCMNSSSIYNISSNKWTSIPNMTLNRIECGITNYAFKNQIIIGGGNGFDSSGFNNNATKTIEIYDIHKNNWYSNMIPETESWHQINPYLSISYNTLNIIGCWLTTSDPLLWGSIESYDLRSNESKWNVITSLGMYISNTDFNCSIYPVFIDKR